jgi:hypothetical protein
VKMFFAKAVAAEHLDDIETYVIVLAEEVDGSGARVELQLADWFDEQDETYGMDTYCVCTEDGATKYGGILGWTLGETFLELRLDEKAAAVFGVEGGFRVEFDAKFHERLERGLSIVLRATRSSGAAGDGSQ